MEPTSDTNQKLKYPKSTWFIVLCELCERFNYFGLRTVLMLYLTTVLKFDGDESTMIYHSFVFMAYFMPLFGAILADSYWGKFKTILWLSIVYVLGNMFLTASSIAEMFSLDVQRIIAFFGLFLISTGTGGIKSCVFTFGGEQFQLPQQEQQLQLYISNFIIAISVGSIIASFLIPELRYSVHCFGKNTCYPVAFGMPTVLMLTAIVFFVAGKNTYVEKKPDHSAISRTFGCIFYALRKNIASSVPSKSHWLDNAKGVYAKTEITDTKRVLNAITAFIAFPVFWALYEQQGSRWTLQGTLMNGHIDYLDWTIKPDQMQTLIPFFGLIFLVLFDVALYPLLAMIGIRKPLQKITLSGLLAVVAFIIAAVLQFKIFGKTTVIPPGEGSVNIYNGFDCKVFVHTAELLDVDHVDPLKMINFRYKKVSQTEGQTVGIRLHFDPDCTLVPSNYGFNTTISVVEGQEISYYLIQTRQNATISLNRISDHDNLIKDKYGNPKLRILVDNSFDLSDNITLHGTNENSFNSYSFSLFQWINFTKLKTGKFNVIFNGQTDVLVNVDLLPATLYTLMIQKNGEIMDAKLFSAYEGNYLHILWQVPQFLCMVIADVIFVVNSMEFAFIEAPKNMKSFVSAFNLLATAAGNILVVLISIISIKNQAHEYLFYAGLMFADTILLVYFNYVYQINYEKCKVTHQFMDNQKEEFINTTL